MFLNLKNFSPLNHLIDLLLKNKKNINIEINRNSFKSLFFLYLMNSLNKNIVLIAPAEDIYKIHFELNEIAKISEDNKKIILYPEDDSFVYENIKASKEVDKLRACAIKQIFENGKKIFVTDINAIVEKIQNREKVKSYFFKFTNKMIVKQKEIIEILEENGFIRVKRVEEVFEYAVRGNILDIFAPDLEYPVRIEFFNDEIGSIRLFSTETYETEKVLNEVCLTLFKPQKNFLENNSSIIDYFNAKNTIIIIDENNKIKSEIIEKIEKIKKYLYEQNITDKIFSLKEIYKKIINFQTIKCDFLLKGKNGIKLDASFNPIFKRKIDLLLDYLKNLGRQNYDIFIASDNEGETKHLQEILFERGIGNVKFINAALDSGFNIKEIKLCVISNREIFERYKGKIAGRIKEKSLKPIKSFLELKEKDYVVHRDYGIGIFEGVKTLMVDDNLQDFILIRYADNDKLYLPMYKINLIDKYVGSENIPALSKLGSPIFRRTKEQIRKELKIIADELLKIYAQRKMAKGIKYGPVDEFEKEFADAFLYEETEDQKKAIEEVLADMESEKTMDRLICGDAGFGKTEVAMRAAFKAVNNGRQVLVVASTTLLAQQHFFTFTERMADYSIKIAMLSRIVSEGKKKKIIDEVKKGNVDILIGTSAVLNSKIEFLNLGLIIIDEEQHFGVKAKEFLRKKYPNVDFLTLTATPIPRTLYFSLSGIRDISVINTPPLNKKPIETFIVEEKLRIVKEIILREILRKGQVFYIHNNINTIYKLKEILSTNLPEVKFKVAHGRLKKTELENIMRDFLAKKYDVLITTTIVESGLDMPDVNTIIISNAEKFGLSQLYQLRGRVGRRDKQAYAYLLVKDPLSISDIAKERLKTIESFVDAGAGFNIAMKDLELRGAGSILGYKQHGNMEKIGFEMYCRMLEEEISKLTNKQIEEEVDTKIKVNYRAYIPDSYIWDNAEKVRIYRQLFLSKSISDIKQIEKSLSDIWGPLPQEVKNILQVATLKVLGRRLKVVEIKQKDNKIEFIWEEKFDPSDSFKKFIELNKGYFKVGKNHFVIEFKDRKVFDYILSGIEKNW